MHLLKFRYRFRPEVDLLDVDGSLLLAIFAAESLHGAVNLQLYAEPITHRERREYVLDASCEVGRDVNRIFTGFLRREFAPESFQVEQLTGVAALPYPRRSPR